MVPNTGYAMESSRKHTDVKMSRLCPRVSERGLAQSFEVIGDGKSQLLLRLSCSSIELSTAGLPPPALPWLTGPEVDSMLYISSAH